MGITSVGLAGHLCTDSAMWQFHMYWLWCTRFNLDQGGTLVYMYSTITQHIGQHSHWVRGVELGVGLGWCHKHTKLVVHQGSRGGCGIALLSSSFPGKESQLKLLWNKKELGCCFPFLISLTLLFCWLLAAAENLCPPTPSSLLIWCAKVPMGGGCHFSRPWKSEEHKPSKSPEAFEGLWILTSVRQMSRWFCNFEKK